VSELFDHLRRVTADLEEMGARYALVGGMAVSLRTEPRFTRDLDLAVTVESDAQAESLIRDLIARGYSLLSQSEHETAQRLATVRLAVPGSAAVVVDLLFASCGIEDVIVAEAESIEALPGWTAPVARLEHLLAMKVLASNPASRPQDHADAMTLLRAMSGEQIDKSRQALQLIESRGFNRTRNLNDHLDALVDAAR